MDKFRIQTDDELATLALAEAAAVTRRATSGSASLGFSAHAVAVAGIYNEDVAKNRSEHPAPLQLRCFVSPDYIEQLLCDRNKTHGLMAVPVSSAMPLQVCWHSQYHDIVVPFCLGCNRSNVCPAQHSA